MATYLDARLAVLLRMAEEMAECIRDLQGTKGKRAHKTSLDTPIMATSDVQMDMANICAAVAVRHGLATSTLMSYNRTAHVSHARQDAMRELHRAGYSKQRIADYFHRDRQTVSHGIRQAEARAGK